MHIFILFQVLNYPLYVHNISVFGASIGEYVEPIWGLIDPQ